MSFLGPPYIEMQTNANCLSSLSAIWDTCGRITSNASAVNVYFHRRCRNEGLRLSLWLSSSAIVWTASRIQRVPHHKRLQPTARNPRECLRWEARAAAFSSTCWPFNDSIWALATVPIMQLHDCHNNATVTCRFEWCGSISALYSAVGYGRRLRFACADSLQLLCFGNLWPISLMGCTICDQFPYWTSLVHEGTSWTRLLASPVLRRCLQTAGFFCIDRPCWAHRLCFSSWPGWFGCRAGLEFGRGLMPAQLARRERPYFFMSGSRPVESLRPNRTRLLSQGGEHHPLCPDYFHLLGTDTSQHTYSMHVVSISPYSVNPCGLVRLCRRT